MRRTRTCWTAPGCRGPLDGPYDSDDDNDDDNDGGGRRPRLRRAAHVLRVAQAVDVELPDGRVVEAEVVARFDGGGEAGSAEASSTKTWPSSGS